MNPIHRLFSALPVSLTILLTLAIASPSVAQAQSPLIPRKEFFTAPQRTAFRLSPTGDRLYFTFENALFYIPTHNPGTPQSLHLPTLPKQWIPTENGILTLTQDSIPQLSHITHTGQSTHLPFPFTPSNIRLIERPVPHATKVALWVEAQTLQDASGIWTLDISTQAFTRIDSLPPFANPILDGNFRPVAATQPNEQGGNTLMARTPEGWKSLADHPMTEDMFTGGFSKILSASADAQTIYYTSNRNTDKTELFAYHPSTQSTERIAHHPDVDLLPFGHSVDLEGHVTSIVGLYAKTLRTCLDTDAKKHFDHLQAKLQGDISWGGQSTDGKRWMIREFTGGPTKYYAYDRPSQTLTYLCTDFPTLETLPLATRHAREVTAKDGTRLPFHVYLPHGSDPDGDGIPDRPLPTILYVHGGPWVGVYHWNSHFHWRNFQLLADRGYAVINCEFRGGTGMGKEFIQKSYQTWGTDMLTDNVAVAQWAENKGIAAKGKVAMWGWSYGGFAAMSSPALFPKQYACAVAMYGISDLEKFSKPQDDFWWERVGNPNKPDEAKQLRKASAIHNLNKIKAPMLLTTGSKDDRIPQPQMGDMAQALQKKGNEVVYFYYPEEVHDYQYPESWISFWAITEPFLARHLGGKTQPLGDDLKNAGLVVEVGEEFVKGLD
jgi:dipeptidyl aminopeptidase/acylaminoacyl peptidase